MAEDVGDESPMRLIVYDATQKPGERGLRSAWKAGARVYRALGRVDAFYGASSWADALDWLIRLRPGETIEEIQYWGHGHWGTAVIAADVLSVEAFEAGHPLRDKLDALRDRFLSGGRSLLWFRTCETFGADRGRRFATRASSHLGARVAGHTYVIGAIQSGLHGLRPNEPPRWSALEGIAEGTPDAPRRALSSSPDAPHTIHFMNGRIDPAWFDG